jgi:hypothetical protein
MLIHVAFKTALHNVTDLNYVFMSSKNQECVKDYQVIQ